MQINENGESNNNNNKIETSQISEQNLSNVIFRNRTMESYEMSPELEDSHEGFFK